MHTPRGRDEKGGGREDLQRRGANVETRLQRDLATSDYHMLPGDDYGSLLSHVATWDYPAGIAICFIQK